MAAEFVPILRYKIDHFRLESYRCILWIRRKWRINQIQIFYSHSLFSSKIVNLEREKNYSNSSSFNVFVKTGAYQTGQTLENIMLCGMVCACFFLLWHIDYAVIDVCIAKAWNLCTNGMSWRQFQQRNFIATVHCPEPFSRESEVRKNAVLRN